MFDLSQIVQETEQIQSGKLFRADSPVYQAWAELADSWLANADGDIHLEGFKGFNQRSVKEIVEDFKLNYLLKDIDFEEIQVTSNDGDIMVSLEYIGEGCNGDYNPNNPEDYPLLRSSVYLKYKEDMNLPSGYCDGDAYEIGEWIYVNNSSYCTSLSAFQDRSKLIVMANLLLAIIEDNVKNYLSIKKQCAEFSYCKSTT